MKEVEDFREDLERIEDSLTLNYNQVRNVTPLIDFTKGFGIEADDDFEELRDQMWDLDAWDELPLVDVTNYHTGDKFEAHVMKINSLGIHIVDTIDYEPQIVDFKDLNEIRDRLNLYEAILNHIR